MAHTNFSRLPYRSQKDTFSQNPTSKNTNSLNRKDIRLPLVKNTSKNYNINGYNMQTVEMNSSQASIMSNIVYPSSRSSKKLRNHQHTISSMMPQQEMCILPDIRPR